MTRRAVLALAALGLGVLTGALACAGAAVPTVPVAAREPVVGLPCEDCDAIFVAQPAVIPSVARIALPDEPGEPLTFEGVVTRDGKPVAGIVVYAHHTNARGIYPTTETLSGTAAYRHGRLRGFVKSDAQGRFRFDTIRPAGYPGTAIPAHIHLHILEPGRCTYWIGDVLFDDDPRLTAEERARSGSRGGPGIAVPRRTESGGWIVTRDIHLGQGVPGYPPAAS